MEREWHAWFAADPKRRGQRPSASVSPEDDTQPGGAAHAKPVSAPSQEMHSVSMMAERKRLRASLRSNHLGQFVTITEEVGHRRTTIVVPASALTEFMKLLGELAALAESEGTGV